MSEKRLGPPSEGARWISSKFTSNDWNKLDLSAHSADWNTAVEIFLDRINGRFLAPIDAIRKHTDLQIAEFAGFVTIAIDCLLIETLVQFRTGQDETKGSHAEAFWSFFKKSDFFKHDFDSKQKSDIFYGHFRCGILHQAQTKKSSLVRYGRQRMVEASVVDNIQQGLIIDRDLFHNALVDEINSYAQRLRFPQDARDRKLRHQFAKKMNLIAK
jgi:hypothetical protein